MFASDQSMIDDGFHLENPLSVHFDSALQPFGVFSSFELLQGSRSF